VTVSDIDAVRVVAPLVPTTEKPVVPVGVEPETETVSELLAEPLAGGVTDDGLKAHEAPDGRPLHERPTAEEKPPLDVTVQVDPPLPPCAIDRLDGLHATLKSGVGAEVTVRLRAAVRVVAPLVPVAWMACVPVAVPPPTAIVNVLLTEPLAGGVTGSGE
jgi:hypothetical protein